MTEQGGDKGDHGDDYDDSHQARNLGALVLIVALIIGGVWLMNEMLRISKLEDCAMAGRRNCGPAVIPNQPR